MYNHLHLLFYAYNVNIVILRVEEHFGTSKTDSILCRFKASVRAVKIELQKIDRTITLTRCLEKALFDADIEKCVDWTKPSDAVLNLGVTHTNGLQAFSRLMSHDGRGLKCQDLLSVCYSKS